MELKGGERVQHVSHASGLGNWIMVPLSVKELQEVEHI